jgi:hypothetical protein
LADDPFLHNQVCALGEEFYGSDRYSFMTCENNKNEDWLRLKNRKYEVKFTVDNREQTISLYATKDRTYTG